MRGGQGWSTLCSESIRNEVLKGKWRSARVYGCLGSMGYRRKEYKEYGSSDKDASSSCCGSIRRTGCRAFPCFQGFIYPDPASIFRSFSLSTPLSADIKRPTPKQIQQHMGSFSNHSHFPKIGTLLGVPVRKIVVFWGL